MQMRTLVCFMALVLAGVLGMPSIGHASSYSAVVVYGDSLSDNGNLYKVSGDTTPASPPYYNGRFSNGPVAVEQLAAKLGLPLYDFAYGGATSGVGNYGDGGTQTMLGLYGLPGMEAELAATNALITPLASSALFVVWGGANDYVVGGSVATAVADIDGIVATLEADGATHILVPGVPDLGLTPDYYGVAGATAYSVAFDQALQASLPKGATYYDTFGLLDSVENNAAAYGITDLTDPCFNGVSVCSNPSQYLFWDGFHPTTTVDSLVAAQFAYASITPEPSSFVLLGTGLAGLAAMVRRRGLGESSTRPG